MRRIVEKKVTRVERVEESVSCDRCGVAIPNTKPDVEIIVQRAERYRDGDSTIEAFDCCETCWAFVKAVFKTGSLRQD